jgi:undecaprenyl diphosphate synthase
MLNRILMVATSGVQHLAVIMDGNRRWAKERGLASSEGHKAGYETLKQMGQWCLDRNIRFLTVFAFSTENWKRTKEEVGYLMGLLEKALTEELEFFVQKEIRLRVLGRLDELSESLQASIQRAVERTQDFSEHTLSICLNYGGRSELVDAVKKIVASGVPADQITESTIQNALYYPDLPEPDLLIRTSGEERLSGFLLWQAAYTELYWASCHWPDFSEKELDAALEDFAARKRRFGK